MSFNLTICAAHEVCGHVSDAVAAGKPYDVALSIEDTLGRYVWLPARAPRLKRKFGVEWERKQIIFNFFDAEQSLFAHISTPAHDVIQRTFDHLNRFRPSNGDFEVLLHCHRGRSRSTGLGLVVLRYQYGPGSEAVCVEELLKIRPNAAPHRLLVKAGDEILEAKLAAAIDEHPVLGPRLRNIPPRKGPMTGLANKIFRQSNQVG